MEVFLTAPTNCKEDLVEDVADARITASSVHGNQLMGKPERARLMTLEILHRLYGAWVAETGDSNQYIQVEFDDIKLITGVSTQGRNGIYRQWVTEYSVLHSADGVTWLKVLDDDCNTMIFQGNADQNTLVKNELAHPFNAKFVRIQPTGWKVSISMRIGTERNPLHKLFTLLSRHPKFCLLSRLDTMYIQLAHMYLHLFAASSARDTDMRQIPAGVIFAVPIAAKTMLLRIVIWQLITPTPPNVPIVEASIVRGLSTHEITG
ncbi:hypothetical protein ScPMuIL_017722 [Solemya velum]